MSGRGAAAYCSVSSRSPALIPGRAAALWSAVVANVNRGNARQAALFAMRVSGPGGLLEQLPNPSREEAMALRDKMAASAAPYMRPGEPVQAIFGGQTASQYLAALGGIFFFLSLNRYRIFVVTPDRILVLDAGKYS